MRAAIAGLALALASCAGALSAQQVTVTPLAHVLVVGDTARTVAVVSGNDSAAVTFTGTDAAVFTAHRDGRITARGVGCAWQRVGYGTWTRAQVSVCVVARDTAAAPPLPSSPSSDSAAASPLAFASDWSFALGSTEAAVKDGERWPALTCIRTFPNVLTVILGAEVGFPLGGNVLRVQMRGPTDCGMLQKNDAVPISTTHWGRFYVRNDERGTKNDHPVAYHNIHGSADIQGVPFARFANRLANGWQPGVVGDAPYPNNKWYGPALENGRWYRYEWQMEYVSATETRVWPRIYAMDGTLLFDAGDFVNDGGRYTLAEWYAAGGTITLANGGAPDPELARNFGMGNEGPGSSTATLGYWYYARLALSTRGWVGR